MLGFNPCVYPFISAGASPCPALRSIRELTLQWRRFIAKKIPSRLRGEKLLKTDCFENVIYNVHYVIDIGYCACKVTFDNINSFAAVCLINNIKECADKG